MSNVDRSASATIRRNRDRAIISFKKLNPDSNLGGSSILSSGILTLAREGAIIADCCIPVTRVKNFAARWYNLETTSPYYPTNIYYYVLSWDTLPCGVTASIASNFGTDVIVSSNTGAVVYIRSDSNKNLERTFTITATTSCNTITATTKGNV